MLTDHDFWALAREEKRFDGRSHCHNVVFELIFGLLQYRLSEYRLLFFGYSYEQKFKFPELWKEIAQEEITTVLLILDEQKIILTQETF